MNRVEWELLICAGATFATLCALWVLVHNKIGGRHGGR